jgi:hypothetical protein
MTASQQIYTGPCCTKLTVQQNNQQESARVIGIPVRQHEWHRAVPAYRFCVMGLETSRKAKGGKKRQSRRALGAGEIEQKK